MVVASSMARGSSHPEPLMIAGEDERQPVHMGSKDSAALGDDRRGQRK
jgi:hypothetical protein